MRSRPEAVEVESLEITVLNNSSKFLGGERGAESVVKGWI